MSLLPLWQNRLHVDTLSLTRKTSLAKLILKGCQMYKSYTSKCKNPTQTENAINGEASETEDREKRRSANKDAPAGMLHQHAVPVLWNILL